MKYYLKTPQRYSRYLKAHDTLHWSICDGMTENSGGLMSILFPLFIVTGCGVFMWILLRWMMFKEKKKEE